MTPRPSHVTSKRREPWKTRAAWWVMLVAIAVSYIYFIPYFSRLNNPNENARVYQIRAFVELGKLSVDEQLRKYGWVNDLAKHDGKHYAGKPPGTTFIGVPIYAALRAIDEARDLPTPSWFRIVYVLRLFGVLLPCLLFVHVFRGFLRRTLEDAHLSSALAVILALGTMMFPYALLFVNHSLTAATSFGALIAVLAACRFRSESTRWSRVKMWASFALSGFLLASSTALDYALFPISVMLLAFVFWRGRWSLASVVGTCLGASIPTLLTAAYQEACWGSPFAVSMSFLANPKFAAEAKQGMFGVIGPTSETVWGVLASPQKGLVYFSPILGPGLIAVVLTALTSRLRKEAVLTFAIVLWMLLYNVSLINWAGGWTVGPRYITVIVPFVLFALGVALMQTTPRWRRWLMAACIGLGIPSVVVTAATSVMFPHLQPEYANPVFECIWPLWRDGFVPRSVGQVLLGLEGRAAQIPFLAVVAALLVWLVVIVALAWRGRPRAWLGAVGGVVAVVAIATTVVWTQSLPRTEDKRRVDHGMRWLRTKVWEPPPPGLRQPGGGRR